MVSIIVQGNVWGEGHMEAPNSHDGTAECQRQECDWRRCIAIRPLYDATSAPIADPTLTEVAGSRREGWIGLDMHVTAQTTDRVISERERGREWAEDKIH